MATISEALAIALQHHRAGRLQAAEQIYRRILEADPDCAEALHLLGLIAGQAGQHETAVGYLERAIELRADEPLFHCNLGTAYGLLQRHAEAIACYGRALELKPDHVEAHCRLGNVLQERGQLAEAVASYRRALELQPDFAEAHHYLGAALRRQGQLAEAVACYRRAVQLLPGHAAAYHDLGHALYEQGQMAEAVACCRRAVGLNPEYAEAYNTLGNALLEQRHSDEAIGCYRRALQLRPGDADVHYNLGNVLHESGRTAEAIASFRRALELRPDSAEALNNLGNALREEGQIVAATACYEQARQLRPGDFETHANLGVVLAEQGRFEEALASYDRALERSPLDTVRFCRATCLPLIPQSVDQLRRARQQLVEGLEALLREGVRFVGGRDVLNPPFPLGYQGLNDRPIQELLARLWSPEPAGPPANGAPRRRQGKIRIGFVSRNLKAHTVGHLWRGVIANLSRRKFSVTVFSLGHADDAVASFLRQHADDYRTLPLQVEAAREAIAGADLDVLYYTDVGMEPCTYCLAQWRLAPVQCVTWGHPVTSGFSTIDYFISSALAESSEADEHYTETLVRLKRLGPYVYRPELPSPRKSRADFQLPADKHLYACLQSLFKLHPEDDEVLAAILRRDPRGELVLLAGIAPHWQKLLRQRLARTAPDVVDRIRFLPRQSADDFLRLNTVVDVLLDPLHFSGGRTSYEALALGIPIVTRPSPYLRGRLTAAMYRAMQMRDCVADTPEQYVEIAVRLGTDPDYRAAIGRKILAANACLFEDAEAVRELETFLEQAVA